VDWHDDELTLATIGLRLDWLMRTQSLQRWWDRTWP